MKSIQRLKSDLADRLGSNAGIWLALLIGVPISKFEQSKVPLP